jgi:hypothetical protein
MTAVVTRFALPLLFLISEPEPSWPGLAWRPYIPTPSYVHLRASALLSVLWDLAKRKKRDPSFRTERAQCGEWVTYAAEWHGPGRMGVTAYRQ